MRRLLIFLATALVALAGATAATAQRAVHLNDVGDLNASFTNDFLSEACGVEVTTTITGAADVTLIYNDAGLVIREIDTTPAATVTFSSQYGSITSPSALTAITVYPGGATVGSTANVTLSGLFGHVTGFIASDAGIDIIANAVVIDFSPEGIPIIDFTAETTFISHGNRESGEDIVNAFCTALGPG
jgi:hypothetical protein